MEQLKRLRRGIMVVLAATEINDIADRKWTQSVFFINDNFPIKEFNQALKMGYYTARRATQVEKEYCYWSKEYKDKEGADLSGLTKWLQERK